MRTRMSGGVGAGAGPLGPAPATRLFALYLLLLSPIPISMPANAAPLGHDAIAHAPFVDFMPVSFSMAMGLDLLNEKIKSVTVNAMAAHILKRGKIKRAVIEPMNIAENAVMSP